MATFSGLTPAYQARLVVDWDRVYSHHDVQSAVDAQIYVVKLGTEVRATFDKLRESGAIRLEVDGESASMGPILEVAYNHILKQMFEPVLEHLDQTPPLTPRTPLPANPRIACPQCKALPPGRKAIPPASLIASALDTGGHSAARCPDRQKWPRSGGTDRTY